MVIQEVYHIPGLCRSLISVSAASSIGSHIDFFHGYCVVHFKLPSVDMNSSAYPKLTDCTPYLSSSLPLRYYSPRIPSSLAHIPKLPPLLCGTTTLATSTPTLSHRCRDTISIKVCPQTSLQSIYVKGV
ncbi:hypothetical protein KP509_12G074000 [Ceratopteris richardii]|uniref:Uncharacterized protein n=1 Tax=Ceratopteris richardii TaxID=49495 RepID=A0A8T2TTE4_CERRI|nr:hypothetical protein KP509_12G074000 [Ceratopteris richardii]